MLFRKQGQRRGRLFYWVCGALVLCVAGLMGYQYLTQLARQSQDDKLIDQLASAKLETTRESKGDPLDWPQWRGIHRDGVAPGDGLLKDWPSGGPPLLWTIKGGGGFSAISVAGKRFVTMIQDGDDEVVVCWEDEGKSAKQLWRYPYKSRFTTNGEGPRATPTIDGDRVYTLGPNGQLLCLTLADGKKVWSKDLVSDFGGTVPKWGHSSSPLVENDLLLINPGGDASAIVALNKMTGDIKWKALKGHPGYSSPVISTGGGVRQVLFFLGEELVSLDPKSGNVYWHFPWNTMNQVNAATPIVVKDSATGDDYVFISSGYNKGCALVRVSKDSDGKPKVEEVYHNNLMKNHFGTSVLHGDYLYGFDESILVCMKFRMDGRKKVKHEWYERDFKKGTLLLAGDNLIVLGENGVAAIVEPTPEKFVEKARFTVAKDGRFWTMPVVAHKRLYIRDEEMIYCYDLAAR
jgi:hypothetical protein